MSEHTPTPWRICDTGNFIYINEDGGAGFVCTVNVYPHIREKCRANARHIVHCVNNHERLVEALRLAMDFINKHPGDPDITKEQVEAWQRLVKANPDALLAALEAEKGGEL